jgi:hypothetical protein
VVGTGALRRIEEIFPKCYVPVSTTIPLAQPPERRVMLHEEIGDVPRKIPM